MNVIYSIFVFIFAISSLEAVNVQIMNSMLGQAVLVNVSNTNEVMLYYNYNTATVYNEYLRAYAGATLPYKQNVMIIFKDGDKQLEYMQLKYVQNTTTVTAETTICPMFSWSLGNVRQSRTLGAVLISESVINVSVRIEIRRMTNFKLELNVTRSVNISYLTSVFLFFQFDNTTEQVNAIVSSNTNTSMVLSIQNAKCQVFDLIENVKYKGSFQSVTTNGSMIIQKSMSQNDSFIIVFVLDPDENNYQVSKQVDVVIQKMISKREYTLPIVCMLLVHFVIFCAAMFLSLFYDYAKISNQQPGNSYVIDRGQIEENASHGQDLINRLHPYISYIFTIFLFYGLPVVQIVMTYQQAVHSTGNQDTCFYNFRCALPLGKLMAFNNIISNIGYVIGGGVFILMVLIRQKYPKIHIRSVLRKDFYYECNTQVPANYGILYAMGLGLCMEGIMSACYHICPNRENFQFDTIYMYLLTSLCMAQIFQSRYPKSSPSTDAFYLTMAGINIIAVVGLFYFESSMVFRIIFVIIHTIWCIFLAICMYNIRGLTLSKQVRSWVLISFFTGNFLLVMALTFSKLDFSTILLCILLVNSIVMIICYAVLKRCYEEHFNWSVVVYSLFMLIFWISALYFFTNPAAEWKKTYAESRSLNQNCVLLDFYDVHDVWHILSSIALFCTFNIVLRIDDGREIRQKERLIDMVSS